MDNEQIGETMNLYNEVLGQLTDTQGRIKNLAQELNKIDQNMLRLKSSGGTLIDPNDYAVNIRQYEALPNLLSELGSLIQQRTSIEYDLERSGLNNLIQES